jgi:hypothetical protein
MKLIDYHKVEKFKNSIDNLNATGRYLNNIDAFDFMYSQKLPDGGYVYYYADNEKKGWSSNNWVLGIVTYVDGKFDFQKVSLKTNKGTIRPGKAKSGYIMLKEEVEKNNFELRLEKINY